MNYKEEALKMLEEGRVVFPLKDLDGNITGVTGKLPLKKDQSMPTYVVYGTGFFGSFDTHFDKIVITEGIIDVLIAQTEKYDNIVSFVNVNPEITFTDEILKRLAKMNKKFVLFFDNDKFGQKSANNLCEKMKSYGIKVYNFKPAFDEFDLTDYLKRGRSIEAVLNSMRNTFATGRFNMEGHTVQTFHYADDPGKHDVISSMYEWEKIKAFNDGYVSNDGSVATIHIKPKYNNETNIEWVKRIFGLYEKYGITEVRIEEIPESL